MVKDTSARRMLDEKNTDGPFNSMKADKEPLYTNLPKIASEINEEVRNDKAVNRPGYYDLPGGNSVIELVEHLNLCQGQAVQHLMRCEKKGNKRSDLMKARWYINRELDRMDRFGDDV